MRPWLLGNPWLGSIAPMPSVRGAEVHDGLQLDPRGHEKDAAPLVERGAS